MSARLPAERLAELVGAVTPFADRAVWNVDGNGWSGRAADPAKVTLLETRLDAGAFAEYRAMEVALGWQVEHVATLLAEDPEAVSVSLEDHELAFETDAMTLEDPIVDPEHVRTPPAEPDVSHPVQVELAADTLATMAGRVTAVGELVTVTYHPREDVLEVVGTTERGNCRLVAERGAEELEAVTGTDPASVTLSTDYVEAVVAALPADRIVTLGLGEDLPLSAGFGLAPKPDARESHYGYATAWVAPRTPETIR